MSKSVQFFCLLLLTVAPHLFAQNAFESPPTFASPDNLADIVNFKAAALYVAREAWIRREEESQLGLISPDEWGLNKECLPMVEEARKMISSKGRRGTVCFVAFELFKPEDQSTYLIPQEHSSSWSHRALIEASNIKKVIDKFERGDYSLDPTDNLVIKETERGYSVAKEKTKKKNAEDPQKVCDRLRITFLVNFGPDENPELFTCSLVRGASGWQRQASGEK